jgi:hypothetical protein
MNSLITLWLDLSMGRGIANMGIGQGQVQVAFVWDLANFQQGTPAAHTRTKFNNPIIG